MAIYYVSLHQNKNTLPGSQVHDEKHNYRTKAQPQENGGAIKGHIV